MEGIDLRLRLMAGEPWLIEGVGELHPPTIREIVQVGYSKYVQYVGLLTLDPRVVLGDAADKMEGINGFDVIDALGDESFVNGFMDAVKFFFKVNDVFHSKAFHQFHVGGVTSGKSVTHDNFSALKEAVEYVACMKSVGLKSSESTPANDRAREIKAKLKRSNEIIAKQKAQDGDEPTIDLSDIISAVTVKSHSTNKVNVWDYTLYQLYDEFKRLQIVDNYESMMLIIPQIGSDKIDLKHWSIPITEE